MDVIADRRLDAIPFHVVKHIDDRLDSHILKVEKLFSDHTRDEMDRYAEILRKIESNNEGAEKRFAGLSGVVKESVEKTERTYEAFAEAFPLNKHGKPDFTGHAKAHESWIEQAVESRALRAYIQKVALAAAVVAVGSWVLVLVWQAVLHGPAK